MAKQTKVKKYAEVSLKFSLDLRIGKYVNKLLKQIPNKSISHKFQLNVENSLTGAESSWCNINHNNLNPVLWVIYFIKKKKLQSPNKKEKNVGANCTVESL